MNLLYVLFVTVLSAEVDHTAPFLEILARSSVYNAGELKAIFCRGKNLEAPIEWYSPSNKSVEERSNKNSRVFVEKRIDPRGDMVALIIHNIQISDSGTWICKSGNLNDSIEITVGEKVMIPDNNVTVEGEEGKSIKFSCEANGYPTPVVEWYFDSSPIPNNSKKYVIRPDHSLEIKKLNHADVGTYVCKVRQKVLSYYTEKTVHLTVQHKPIVYNPIKKSYTTKFKTVEVYAIVNETKNITCCAIANPLPAYYWYRRRNSNFDVPIPEEDPITKSEDERCSVLVLRMRNDSDVGEYKCTANNTWGQEFIIFDVSLGSKPKPPDCVRLVSANVTELTFNVTCTTCRMKSEEGETTNPQDLTILGYTFQFTPVQEGYPANWETPSTLDVNIENPDDTIFTVGPLDNATTFHARVSTRNAAGNSEWVEIVPNPRTADSAVLLISTVPLLVIAFLITRWY